MSFRFVRHAVGKMLQILGLLLLLPLAIAVRECAPLSLVEALADPRAAGLLVAALTSILAGTFLVLLPRGRLRGNGVREGFAIVTFGWLVLAFFGCIPFWLYFMGGGGGAAGAGGLRCFTDAYFEIMSGFTTTGSTILTDIESMPRGLLFWRSMTHWLGGMGIVTLALAIFPAFGVSAYQMFRGEVPGPSAERLEPRLQRTALILWGVYALLTLAEAVLLRLGGMSVFDAVCHAFGTMATGGFSTRNASIAAYNSAYIDWVITAFMFFAGMNFIIHYQIIFNRNLVSLKEDREFHFYLAVILISIVIITVVLRFNGLPDRGRIGRSFRSQPLSAEVLDRRITSEGGRYESIASTVRYASFQVLAIVTTTGYCTADFDMWPDLLRFLLVVLMFFGGCAGSTGGGMKMIRIMVVLKLAWREVRTMIQPRLIAPVRIAKQALSEADVRHIVGFCVLYLLIFVFFSAVMTLFIPDLTTAATSVAATLCNIGPGLSGVGASESFAWIPLPGKWVLILCMLLGRLEVYTVIIAFAPMSWRK